MRCLKLKLFQETACYRKPFSFKVAETYPLPPYSTVKGFLHNAMRADKYYNMYISVQGKYESLIENYQTFRLVKSSTVTTMPLKVHLLYNVETLIHVYAEEEVLNRVYRGLLESPEALSLGRREDLVTIREIKYVDVEPFDTNSVAGYPLKMNVYYPLEYELNTLEKSFIRYSLRFKYDKSKGYRDWVEVIEVAYIESGTRLFEKVYIDKDGDIVLFHRRPGVT